MLYYLKVLKKIVCIFTSSYWEKKELNLNLIAVIGQSQYGEQVFPFKTMHQPISLCGCGRTTITHALNTLGCEAPTQTLDSSSRTPAPTKTNIQNHESTPTTQVPSQPISFSLEHLKQTTFYHSLNPTSTQAPMDNVRD